MSGERESSLADPHGGPAATAEEEDGWRTDLQVTAGRQAMKGGVPADGTTHSQQREDNHYGKAKLSPCIGDCNQHIIINDNVDKADNHK